LLARLFSHNLENYKFLLAKLVQPHSDWNQIWVQFELKLIYFEPK
jgi:hypothetical protein